MSRMAPRILTVTANASATYGDLILAAPSGAAIVVTLPLPSVGLRGVEVQKSADSPYNVTVNLATGAALLTLSNVNQHVRLEPTGTGWVVTATVAGTTPTPAIPGAVFDPTSIAGLVFYMKPSGSLYQESTKTTLATADGDRVGAVADASGTAHDALQATAANRATLKLNILNGLRGVRFAAPQSLRALFTLTQPHTTFLVVKAAAGGANQYFIDGSTDNAGAVGTPNATTFGMNGVFNLGGKDATVFNIVAAKFNGASSQLAVGTTNTTGNAGTAGPGGVTLGNSGSNSVPLNGDIVYALVYNSALSSANINQVGQFLATATGLPWTNVP